MKHLQQPNRWSCMATSFAMVLDTTVDEVFRYTGHDGSDIAFPSLPEPHRRRGHTLYEMIHFALSKGISVVPFEPSYEHISLHSGGKQKVLLNSELIDAFYKQSDMVLLGRMPHGASHAGTWSSYDDRVFDPNGIRYFREKYPMTVELYLLCLPLKQHLSLPQRHANTLPQIESMNLS